MAKRVRSKEQMRAEYRARVERGRARGLSASESVGQQKRQAAAVARAEKRVEQGRTRRPTKDHPPEVWAGGGRSVTKGQGGMRITSSEEIEDLERALRRAIANGSSVVVRAIVWTDKGVRSVTMFDGKPGKVIGAGRNGLGGSVQITEHRNGSGVTGEMSGQALKDLLAMLKTADSLEQWVYDLIDQEYGESEY